jgi:NADPH-dependent 2,4-dienoyl-CoA reductase/sulfur reductase-like enzyme
LIVIGSGPAGVAAAAAFREYCDDVPVRMLTADVDRPYFRPPLSKEFLRGETEDVSRDGAEWCADHGVELLTGTRVDAIEVEQRVVVAAGARYPYTELILACGASPTPPPVPGGDLAHILRSQRDAIQLRDAARRADSAVVIGAGFIGCEAAASLAMQGLSVTLVAPDEFPQQKRLGAETGQRLAALVEKSGTRFVGDTRVQEITGDSVVLDDGVSVHADLIVAATGVAPNSAIAETGGLEVKHSRIVVDAGMQTFWHGVFAAGDVALGVNTTARRPIAIEHWQDATDQGAVAGRRAAGADAAWSQVPGFWTTIGDETLKYHAWGDGYDRSRLVDHGSGCTVWYEADEAVVGVLTHNADDDYDLGERLIRDRKPAPVPMQ